MPRERENVRIVWAHERQKMEGCNGEKSLIRDTAPLVIHSYPIHKKNKGGRDGQGEMRSF